MTEQPKRLRIAGVPLHPRDEQRVREIGSAAVNVIRNRDAESVIGFIQTLGPLGPRAPRRPAKRRGTSAAANHERVAPAARTPPKGGAR